MKNLKIEYVKSKCNLCGSADKVVAAHGPVGYVTKICESCIEELSKVSESKLLLARATNLIDQATLLIQKANKLKL